ncbi:MAG: FAD-dependent oxidoreductase, partial [Patescibacteria group bacterium]
GGGPAGGAAAVYAARKKIKSLLITKDWGGQSNVSLDVQNWIGIISMSGLELAKRVEEHVKAYAKDVLEFDEGSLATKINKKDSLFEIETDNGKKYQTKSILLASGSYRRKLEVKGAKEFEHKGIVYCASCDAPLFRDKEVAVIGGGNAGFETAQQLLAWATKVYILERGEEFRADPVTQEIVLKDKKVFPLRTAELLEIKGDKFVKGLVYRDQKEGKERAVAVEGIFVEIGSLPNSDFIKGLVELNKWGEVVIDHKTGKTSAEGIWAAGDVTDQPYKQNNISMGDAVKALEDLYLWLQKKK